MKTKLFILTFFFLVGLFINTYSQSDYYYNLGINAYKNADFEEASKYLKLSIATTNFTNELLPQMYYKYAQAVYHNTRLDWSKSITLLDTALRYDKNYNQAYFFAARIWLMELGMNDYSIKSLEKVKENSSSNFRKDIYYKSLTIYYLNGVTKAIANINATIDAAKELNISSINPECNYSLAAIYALAESNQLALNYLEFALKANYNDLEFLFMDFYNLRKSQGFLNLMKKYNIPEKLYNTISTEERIILETIKNYVEVKINNWQKKGKFEKSLDYQNRVTEDFRNEKIVYYTQAAIDSIGASRLKWNNVEKDYDADNESFMITFEGYNPIFIQVPITEAPRFDANFSDLEFNNFGFLLTDNHTIEIGHVEITDSNLGRSYIYDIQNKVPYSSTQFAFNFDKLVVPIDQVNNSYSAQKNNQTTQIINVGKSDVDNNIPVIDDENENIFALIIGNEDYTKYQNNLDSESNVDFARRDARIFSEYVNKTLGVPNENITLIEDAISSQMNREIEKISKLSKYSNGEATIIFYFAGHGFPDEVTKEAYLMPVDISGTDVKYGIKLNDLYAKLTANPAQKVIVILDACFSGGGRNQGLLAARGVKIRPKVNPISGNLLVFSASSGEQSSLPYTSKQHGMFTYFLLKKLKQTKGNISLEQLSDYVIREVQLNAIRINSKEQNPNVLVSPDVENLWMDWKLN